MEQLVVIAHVIVAIGITALILLQQGKGADMGASFGSGSSQTIFGPAGTGNVLSRATALLAALFFATSFGLAVLAKDKAASVTGIDIDIPVVQTESVLESSPQPADNTALPQSDIPVEQQAPSTAPETDIPE